MMWLCGVQCQLRAKPYVEPDGANLTVMVVFVTIHKERVGHGGYLWPMTVPKNLEMEIHSLGGLKHQLKARSQN